MRRRHVPVGMEPSLTQIAEYLREIERDLANIGTNQDDQELRSRALTNASRALLLITTLQDSLRNV